MPTNMRVDVPARVDADRAPHYLLIAHALDVDFDTAYAIADQSIDCDRAADMRIDNVDPLVVDTLLLLAQSSYTSDDDFDDYRAELSFFTLPALEYLETYDSPLPPAEFDADLVRRVNAVR